MKYFVIYAFLSSIFLAYVGDVKKRFKWTAWTLIILIGVIIFLVESSYINQNSPITKQNFNEILLAFQNEQDSLSQVANNNKIENISKIEKTNERKIKKFISDNPNLNSIVKTVKIPIAFYLVGDSVTQKVKVSQLENQITELNSAFRDDGINFSFQQYDKFNSDYLGQNSLNLVEYKDVRNFANLIDRDKLTLNIILSDYKGLGDASMPIINSTMSTESYHYGGNWIVLNFKALPGGSMKEFNSGKQLVHEIGHWFGLYHVFSGGCKYDGDYVMDTPMQNQIFGKPNVTKACDTTKFTQIHNYMQYVDDDWMNSFTKGQITRMKAIISIFKPQFVDKKEIVNLNFESLKRETPYNKRQ